jgi:hypothetical protein
MNSIKPIIFLLPTITLFVITILYFILLKKSSDKRKFKRYIFIVIIVSFLLNVAWKLIQMPLYKNATYNFDHIAFCVLASIADVLMVLLMYFMFAFILKNLFWIQHLKIYQILLIILTGGVGAVLSEIRHLSLGSWVYNFSMPIIPILNVGISPVLQFMLLPLFIYKLSFYFSKKNDEKKIFPNYSTFYFLFYSCSGNEWYEHG